MWEVFSNININVFYKAIFVVFSIILILSFFVPTIGISNEKMQRLALTAVLYSFSAWFINDTLGIWQRQMNELRGTIEPNYVGNLKKVITLNVGLFFIFLVIFLNIYRNE